VRAGFPSAITGWERFIFLKLLNGCKTFISNTEEEFVQGWTLATKGWHFEKRLDFSSNAGLFELLLSLPILIPY
jgi:hypothetical protein